MVKRIDDFLYKYSRKIIDAVDEYDAFVVLEELVKRIKRYSNCRDKYPRCHEAEKMLYALISHPVMKKAFTEKRQVIEKALKYMYRDRELRPYASIILKALRSKTSTTRRRYRREPYRRTRTQYEKSRRMRTHHINSAIVVSAVIVSVILLALYIILGSLIANNYLLSLKNYASQVGETLSNYLSHLVARLSTIMSKEEPKTTKTNSAHVIGTRSMVSEELENTVSAGTSHEPGYITSTPRSSIRTVKSATTNNRHVVSLVNMPSFRAWLNSTHLVFEWLHSFPGGLEMEIPIVLDNGRTIWLTPFVLEEHDAVLADEVFANETYSFEAFSLNKIAQIIGEGRGVIELANVDYKCDIRVKENKVIINSCRHQLYIPAPNPSSNTIYDVVITGINDTSISIISKTIYGNDIKDPKDAIWVLLQWLKQNTKYDYTKASIQSPFIENPLEFLEARMGVCVDYAVFSAAALLGAGFNKTYILSMNTDRGLHATAAINLTGYFIIVDQRPPPLDWDDYIEYMKVDTSSPILVYEIWLRNGKPQIRSHLLDYTSTRDSWPSDSITDELAKDAARIAARLLGAKFTPMCKSTASMKFIWRWSILSYYTPLFHKQWAEYVGKEIARSFKFRIQCLWAEKSSPNTILLYYK